MVTASERVIHIFTKKYMHACRNHRLTFPEDEDDFNLNFQAES